MQSAARINDSHECAEVGPNIDANLKIENGSPNIMINGKPAARMGDPVSCRLATGSAPVISEGAPNVLFNGKPAARMGDKTSTGGSINQGSTNIFIGDGNALISFGDGVQVTFGDGCAVYLNCNMADTVVTSPPASGSTEEVQPTLAQDSASLALDFVPVVGAGKSLAQVVTGKDLVTGEVLDRRVEAVGIILGVFPGGKALVKCKKIEEAVSKSVKKLGEKYLEKKGINIHAVKKDAFGRNGRHWDIAIDTSTGKISYISKKNVIVPTNETIETLQDTYPLKK